jgi:hypothetical protein
MGHDPNILAAWLGFLAGITSGGIAGLFFHSDSFLGGYSTWPRRLMRLGHIAFFGIGLLNLAYALTVHTLRFSSPPRLISLSLASATLLMPLTCYLSAACKPLRHLFFIPVLATLTGIAGVLYYRIHP